MADLSTEGELGEFDGATYKTGEAALGAPPRLTIVLPEVADSSPESPRRLEGALARGRLLAALGATEEARHYGVEEAQFEQSRREVEAKLGPAWAAWRKLTAGQSA